ncbi:C2 domain-containing protein [Forsythia ovata]|uniref:C2 domain-containing protein n=1 Tax=Forsythia ovata TaxID=205694 RepID=A0ABD1TAX5_9LAMI
MEKETNILDLYAGFEDCINYFAAKTLTGTPAFTAVQIRRPSCCFHAVLNIAATVYDLSDFAILNKTHVLSFSDMMGKEKRESKPRRGKISRDGSKQSEQSFDGGKVISKAPRCHCVITYTSGAAENAVTD